MKRLYPTTFIAIIVITAIAASVKISDLTLSTSPSTNTFLEIADMNDTPKSKKYLLTNLVTQSAFTSATNSITTSAANWTASGTTNSTLTGVARANAVVATNGITAGASTFTTDSTGFRANASQITDLLVGGMAVSRTTITHGANVTLDCGLTNRYASCTLTGNVTFVTSNLSAGKWYNVILTLPATNTTPTFPAWKWLGGAPSTFTASQIGVLSIYPTSTTDATTLAAYTETQ